MEAPSPAVVTRSVMSLADHRSGLASLDDAKVEMGCQQLVRTRRVSTVPRQSETRKMEHAATILE